MNVISVVMIVKDGAATIRHSLASLAEFHDVVVYDNGSTDRTSKIAAEFPNVRVVQGEFVGFGPTKNRAIDEAKNDWILILDADEVVEPELADYLLNHAHDPETVYRVNFKAFYRDRQIRHSGWNNQKIRRFFNRTRTRFNSNQVHEDVIVDSMRIEDIPVGSIQHYSYNTISEFIVKVDRYSSLFAENNRGKKSSSPLKAFLNGGYSFFRTYVLKRGFLDGYPGLLIAFSHMATNFYKYLKLYEANLDERKVRK
jgi:glycosyltransferase involved in cell wall biosynthesis